MTMTDETFDQMCERVAGEMTTAPGDPAMLPQLRGRLEQQRWLRPWLMSASVLTAASVALVLVLSVERRATPLPQSAPLQAAAVQRPISEAYVVAGLEPRRPPLVTAPESARGRGREQTVPALQRTPDDAHIPDSLLALAADELSIEALDVITPVAIAALDVARLDMAGVTEEITGKELR